MEEIPEIELTQESIKAAMVYLKKAWDGMVDAEKRSDISTSFSHGFFMGVRWHEDRLKQLAKES